MAGRVFSDADFAAPAAAPAAPKRTFSDADFAPAAAPISKTESFLRGAAQGVSLGFADEIAGFLEGAFTSKTYAQARDESRAAHSAAKAANPKTYAGGEIGAGVASALVPGLNIAKGAGAAAMAARAAATGAIAGLGSSEADLTKGDFGAALKDTAVGGFVGGALGGVAGKASKFIKAAPDRADEAALASLKTGVTNKTKSDVFGKLGQNEEKIRRALDTDKPLKKIVRNDSREALDKVDEKMSKIGESLDVFYDAAQEHSAGALTSKVVGSMEKVRNRYAKVSATKPVAEAIDKAIENFKSVHPGKRIKYQDLRAEYRAYQDIGYEAAPMFKDVPLARQIWRDTAHAMREVLHDSVDRVAQKHPELGIDRIALNKANQEASAWLGVQRILTEKVGREVTKSPTFGQMISRSALVGVGREALEKTGDVASQAIAPLVRRAQKSPRVTSAATTAADAATRVAGQQAPAAPDTVMGLALPDDSPY